MKTAYLLDTSFSAIPLARAILSSTQYDLKIVGNRKNDPLVQLFPEKHVHLDYSESIQSLDIAHTGAILVPGCNDDSIRSYLKSHLNEKFQKPNKILQLMDKSGFRSLAQQAGLRVPAHVDLIEDDISSDVIVKPKDSFGGRGITILSEASTAADVAQAIEKSKSVSKSRGFVAQAFVRGELYSASAFFSKGHLYKLFTVREFVDSHLRVSKSFLSGLTSELEISLSEGLESLANLISLDSGLIHMQFIVSAKSNELFGIEATIRCPGDHYGQLITEATGFNYFAHYLAPFVDEINVFEQRAISQKRVRQTVVMNQTAKLDTLHFAADYERAVAYVDPTKVQGIAQVGERIGVAFGTPISVQSSNLPPDIAVAVPNE